MRSKDTSAWIFQVWTSFAVAIVVTTIGICYLPLDIWHRGFLGMGFLFSVASAFTLAKTLRDNHEAAAVTGKDGQPYR